MTDMDTMIQAAVADRSRVAMLILADYIEEQGMDANAELLRAYHAIFSRWADGKEITRSLKQRRDAAWEACPEPSNFWRVLSWHATTAIIDYRKHKGNGWQFPKGMIRKRQRAARQ